MNLVWITERKEEIINDDQGLMFNLLVILIYEQTKVKYLLAELSPQKGKLKENFSLKSRLKTEILSC